MKRIQITGIALVIAFALAVATQPWIRANEQSNNLQKQLIGNWYKGTMSGFDCNLKIISPNTLNVQFGGCFHQDPAITTAWKLQGNRIIFQSTALNNSLGSYLQIVQYKNHLVLVPGRPQANRGKHKYSYYHCFWRNTMKNGLQLSKDAPE